MTATHGVLPGYFSAEHPAALVAPNGARITGDLVELLAGSPAPDNMHKLEQLLQPMRSARRKSRRRRHRLRDGVALRSTSATRSTRAILQTGPYFIRHRLPRRHRAQSRRRHANGVERLFYDPNEPRMRRCLAWSGAPCLRRRQGRPWRRHENRDPGRDHGRPRHRLRLRAGTGRDGQRQPRQCDHVVRGGRRSGHRPRRRNSRS